MPDVVEITELVELDIDRFDAVASPANGTHFLLLKSLSCGCAACASVAKADMSAKSINDLPDSAFAHIEPGGSKDEDGKTTPRKLRHFPVHDAAHVRNALARAPQSPFGDKAMPKIKSAAAKFGVEVSKETKPVADDAKKDCPTCKGDGKIMGGKRDCPDCAASGKVTSDKFDSLKKARIDALERLVFKADGDGADEPGSGPWEAADSASARDIATAIAGLTTKVEAFKDREMAEVQAGHTDDISDVYDLEDACSLLDAALGLVSSKVFTEAEESNKAAAADSVTKAGKRLSSKSKSHITSARDAMVQASGHLTDLLGADEEAGKTGQEPEEGEVNKEEMTELLAAQRTSMLEDVAKMIAAATPAAAPVAEPAVAPVEDVTKTAATDALDIAAIIKGAMASGATAVVEALAPRFDGLEGRLDTVEKMAAPTRAYLGGGSPAGASDDELAPILKSLEDEKDGETRQRLQQQALRIQLRKLYGG